MVSEIKFTGPLITEPNDLQVAMLERERATPDGPAASVIYARKIDRRIEIDTLSEAIRISLSRQAASCTKFAMHDGNIVLKTQPNDAEFSLAEIAPLVDLRDFWRTLLSEQFPHFVGPLNRFHVSRGSAETVLFLHSHHALMDGLSASFVMSDIEKAYNRLESNLSTQNDTSFDWHFCNYLKWHSSQRGTDYFEQSIEYWNDYIPRKDRNLRNPPSGSKPRKTTDLRSVTRKTLWARSEQSPRASFINMAEIVLKVLANKVDAEPEFCAAFSNRMPHERRSTYGFFASVLPVYGYEFDLSESSDLHDALSDRLRSHRQFGRISSFELFRSVSDRRKSPIIGQPRFFLNYIPFTRTSEESWMMDASEFLPPIIPAWCDCGLIVLEQNNQTILQLGYFPDKITAHDATATLEIVVKNLEK